MNTISVHGWSGGGRNMNPLYWRINCRCRHCSTSINYVVLATTLPVCRDEQSLFKATGHPIMEDRDKVACTCTCRTQTTDLKGGGVCLTVGLTKEQRRNFKVILKYEAFPRIVMVVTWSQTFDVSPFFLFFSFFFFMCDIMFDIWENKDLPALSKAPLKSWSK